MNIDMKEWNITVKSVEDITDTFLMMGPNQQEKDFVTMDFVCIQAKN